MVNRYPGQLVRGSDTEVLFALKLTDESLTSSTTLQNDDTLLFPVEASATYEFTATVVYVGNTTGDFKLAFTFPSGATLYWVGKGTPIGLDNSFGAASGTSLAYSGETTNQSIVVQAVLTTGSTAGTLQLQWAQNTSNATATVVKTGSFIRAQRRE